MAQLFGLTLVCASVYGVLWYLDFGRGEDLPPWLWVRPESASALLNFGEVTVAVLGIAMTVVSILVELAATRYTPRISEMVLRDPGHASVMGLYIVTSVLVVWIEMSVGGPVHPRFMAGAALALMSFSMLTLLPYFVYVFEFLEPTAVVGSIEGAARRALRRVRGRPDRVSAMRDEVRKGVEQLGDIGLRSVENHDKPITVAVVEALGAIAMVHLEEKGDYPEAWHDSSGLVREDSDFVAFHEDTVEQLTGARTWLEMKVLLQFQVIFQKALHDSRELAHLTAIHTRRFGQRAIELGDDASLRLGKKLLNTYLRSAINGRDVRSAYNVLNEYRLLAETMLERDHPRVKAVATRMSFYGQTAFQARLPFLLETVAYDLAMLIERAYEGGSAWHDGLLDVFLDVDREPHEAGQEASLRGVRKAQVRLATFYLQKGDLPLARRIHADMVHEPPQRLQSIREELEGVVEAEYWEVSDRGVDFDYLPPERRALLGTFFGWFPPPRRPELL